MKRLAITLLGHKDHGKSTLIGRLLHDTKSVMEDRIEEVLEHSKVLGKPFEYAFLLDSFEEERRDGMTIDVIHAQVKGKKHLYDCIDVPGHRMLLNHMLSGASHANAGILIVSAKEGLEEQTRHHLRLAHWLGLDTLMIVVNKMDQVEYSQQIFDEMVIKIKSLQETSDLLQEVEYIPISAYQGDNVVNHSQNMAWYSGKTLFEQMEQLEIQDRFQDIPLRLPIQDIYEKSTGEMIIAGRIESGKISVGQQVLFVLSQDKATIKAIMAMNEYKTTATIGENIGIILDRNLPNIKRGEVCCRPEDTLSAQKEVVAHAILLEEIPQELVVECGSSKTECVVEPVIPAEIGEVSTLRFTFRNPIVVERAKTSLGRLALKRRGKIVGVAVAF